MYLKEEKNFGKIFEMQWILGHYFSSLNYCKSELICYFTISTMKNKVKNKKFWYVNRPYARRNKLTKVNERTNNE